MAVDERRDHPGPDKDTAVGGKRSRPDSHEEGYEKSLKPRQIRMIAIGGAIGTGLFLGAGARLQITGPALALVYLVCGCRSSTSRTLCSWTLRALEPR